MNEVEELAYNDRLKKLNALTVDRRMTYADMVFVYKSLYGHVSCPGDHLGLSTVVSRTRQNGVAFVQRRAAKNAAASTFSIRAPSSWNKLPITAVQSVNLHVFLSEALKSSFALWKTVGR